MEVNNTVLKKIIRECCRSLSYNDEERQFSFSLQPYLDVKWEKLNSQLELTRKEFYRYDFNALLNDIIDLIGKCKSINISRIDDSSLLNGEILEVNFTGQQEPVRLIKMKNGQYLDYSTGNGISLGGSFRFEQGRYVKTSNGIILGEIASICILSPTNVQLALSSIFLGYYYKNHVADSLWPLFELAVDYGNQKTKERLQDLLDMSNELGVSIFTSLHILNAAIKQWR